MNYADEKIESNSVRGPSTDFDVVYQALYSLEIENENLRRVIELLQIKADAFDVLVSFPKPTQNYACDASSSAGYHVYLAREALERIKRKPGENIADLDASDLVPEAPEQSAAIPTDEEILRRLKRIADHIGIPSEGKLPSKGTASAY